jgi:hypothetical protein
MEEELTKKGLSLDLASFNGDKITVKQLFGDAPKEPEPLPIKEPVSISLNGVIDTPARWLEKRVDTVDINNANVIVDREAMTIKLTINETDYYNRNTFVGTVALSEIFEKMKINVSDDAWAPSKLGQFLRLNRGVFEDPEQCMVLVSKLKNFTAKAKAEIQKMKDPSGSVAEVYKSEVESNLPKSFVVNIAIFKGTPKQRIEIEFDHYLKDNDVYLQLVSPGANEIVEQYRDKCIDDVLNQIRSIAPGIVIMEV